MHYELFLADATCKLFTAVTLHHYYKLFLADATSNHSIEGRSAKLQRSRGTVPHPPRVPVAPAPHQRHRRKLAGAHDSVAAHDDPPGRSNPEDGTDRGGNAEEKRAGEDSFEAGNGDFGASSPTPGSESDYDDYYEDESADYNWSEDYYKYKQFARHYMYSDLFTSEFPLENGGLCPNNTRIFVFVNSRVESTETRNSIRKSYLKILAKQKIPYAFLISKPSSKLAMIKLEEENRRFNDLVVVGSLEDYANLTLKTGHMIRWVGRHCPAHAYVAKVDDDVYVNVPKFLKVLEKNRQKTVLGHVSSMCF